MLFRGFEDKTEYDPLPSSRSDVSQIKMSDKSSKSLSGFRPNPESKSRAGPGQAGEGDPCQGSVCLDGGRGGGKVEDWDYITIN